MTTKHFVIDPNGKKHTRTSQNRVYSHCVLVRDGYELALARAKSGEFHKRNYISNFNYYCSISAGTHDHSKPWAWEQPEAAAERITKDKAAARVKLEGVNTPAEYLAKLIAADIAAVEKQKAAGYYDKYGYFGWCSRYDLAQKQADKARASGRFDSIIILEAQQETSGSNRAVNLVNF